MLTGAASGFVSLFVLRLALGFAEGAAFPTATRAMSTWIPVRDWGFAQGITHSFARIGNALTPPLMAALLLFVSWRRSFVILGFGEPGLAVVWAWYFRNDPREHPAITEADLAALPQPGNRDRPAIPWLRLARRILPGDAGRLLLRLDAVAVPELDSRVLLRELSSEPAILRDVLGRRAFAGRDRRYRGRCRTDRLLRKTGSLVLARRSVIVTGFLGAFIFLCPVVLFHNLAVAAVCLSLAFFFAELIVAPIWAVPMDIAPRYAGSASGMMNFGFGVAGLVSPSSFGYLVDRTGSWVFPFICSMLLLLVGAVLASRLRPDKTLVEGSS